MSRPQETTDQKPRFCIAKDGKKWRVYDDARKQFAEPSECASSKAAARGRANTMNGAAVLL